MEEIKEKWYKSLIFFIPRIISHLFSSLDMTDKGWSLKKILAVFCFIEAAHITNKILEPNNVIIFTAIWLGFGGLMVGLYSFGDLTKAASQLKGNKVEESYKEEIITKIEETKV